MRPITIEQAVYRLGLEPPPTLQARSAGFRDEWRADVEPLLAGFGLPPGGVACPAAVFAQPLGKTHVAVVQASDRPGGAGPLREELAFHVLVLARADYEAYLHDPFLVAGRLPPDWEARDTLPALTLPAAPPPGRTVEEVRRVLQRVKGPGLREDVPVEDQEREADPADRAESPALLGGVQALLDGGRLAFERPQPDADLLGALWTLLPRSSRGELWPASFAFNGNLPFDVLVVPRFRRGELEGYLTEDQAADYPEGRYELALQFAAEQGNQRDLDELFERRSAHQTWRLGMTLLLAMLMVVVGVNLFPPPPPGSLPPGEVTLRRQANRTAGMVGLADPLGMAAYLAATDQHRREVEGVE